VAIQLARRRGLTNFSALASHVLTPPALTSILQSPDNHVRAFLGPGHVCSVMGYREYEQVSQRYRIPIVITGYEPLDILEGILRAVRQLERGEAFVDNQYARSVQREGTARARAIVDEVFEVCDRQWRGVGTIPKSGLRLSYEYREFDAERIFEVDALLTQESSLCISGQVLRGRKKPSECPAFGRQCTPESPLGATMVSSEGACAAYYAYGRYLEAEALCRSRPSVDLRSSS
jgi:hydrogenase expression/formation protein HypD